MHFEVGDTVLLVHSGEEGVIVEILDSKTVSVRVNGTIFPVFNDQLDFPYFKRFTEKHFRKARSSRIRGEELPLEKPSTKPKDGTGVLLSFLPEYEHSGEEALIRVLKLHLINDTNQGYDFSFRLLLNRCLEIEVNNRVSAFQHFYLADLEFESLNDHPRFEFSFSLIEPLPGKQDRFPVIVRPKAKQIIRQLERLRESGGATFSHLLFRRYPDQDKDHLTHWDIPRTNPGAMLISPTGRGLPPPVYEVDLHIEKLIPHRAGLSSSDMLGIQLAEVHKQLDMAIAHRQSHLVVIHGVGKGTLRQEVHEILRHVREVKSFVNQYNARYGFGATEIFFEYK